MNVNTGKIVYKKSVANLLINNNNKGLLLGTSSFNIINKDLIHINDIQPIRKNTNFALEGDLLLSIRNKSTIILYRPSIDSILWCSTGPWINQHDVDVLNDNMIGIYNNNNIRRRDSFFKNTFSNISTYNFKTRKYGTFQEQIFKDLKIQSNLSSRFEILDDGNLFVEDSPNGMYYFISKKGYLISSKNFHYDKKNICTGQWARPYKTKKY